MFGTIQTFYINAHSVCVIVFDMTEMIDPAKKEGSVKEVIAWLNKVIMYTLDNSSSNGREEMAPIYLVGTHKDIVDDEQQHVYISNELEEAIKKSPAYKHIRKNRSMLCMYMYVYDFLCTVVHAYKNILFQ